MANMCVDAGSGGVILFDAAIAPDLDHHWFDPAWWQAQDRLRDHRGGRGGAYFIATPLGDCVLRHYHRGGHVARVLGDRYPWRGQAHTRSFAEFQLLQTLNAWKLPVPVPVAARYQRNGMLYRADLIMRQLPGSTLAEHLREGGLRPALARQVGAVIGRFHREGVYHADLNAHNVLVDGEETWLLDFDRGCLRPPADTWQRANRARLHRSLIKLGAANAGAEAFERGPWTSLLAAYNEVLAR